MNEFDPTVTYWIQHLKTNDAKAAREIWDRYFHKLIALARKKLGSIPQRVIDPEDVAVSVFKSLCLGAARGHFPALTDRHDLWRLLVTITHQKTVDHIRHANSEKRGGGNVRGDSVFIRVGGDNAPEGFDGCLGDVPEPDFLVILQDQFQHLLSLLRNQELRQIAIARLEGKTNSEIADELKISRRSVERKLSLIREDWEGQLGEDLLPDGNQADTD